MTGAFTVISEGCKGGGRGGGEGICEEGRIDEEKAAKEVGVEAKEKFATGMSGSG